MAENAKRGQCEFRGHGDFDTIVTDMEAAKKDCTRQAAEIMKIGESRISALTITKGIISQYILWIACTLIFYVLLFICTFNNYEVYLQF